MQTLNTEYKPMQHEEMIISAPSTTIARWVFTSSPSLPSQALTASIEIWGKWF